MGPTTTPEIAPILRRRWLSLAEASSFYSLSPFCSRCPFHSGLCPETKGRLWSKSQPTLRGDDSFFRRAAAQLAAPALSLRRMWAYL